MRKNSCFIGFLGALTITACERKEERPNILFIYADDLGYMDLACYGSEFYETPNIDKLAEQGVLFTDAYMTPVCSPSRNSLMTGKHSVRNGLTDWLGSPGPEQALNNPNWSRKMLPAPSSDRLEMEEVTIADLFKQAGYRTFFAGKWHLGPEGYWPEDQGFDINKGGYSTGTPRGVNGYFSPYNNPRLSDGEPGEELPMRLAVETTKFLESYDGKPFFAMLSFYLPHVPLAAPDFLIQKYEKKREDNPVEPKYAFENGQRVRQYQDHPVYAGMIEWLDTAFGVVLDKLDELGLADNTIVVFSSDNGGLSITDGWPTSNYPLRGGKGWLYEGGIRVPLIIRDPFINRAGSVVQTPVMAYDFLPAFMDMAGLIQHIPDDLDGESFYPALKGHEMGKRALYWHYPHYGNQGGWPGGIIRYGDYKLIHLFENDKFELYDLADDIGENINLVEKRPEVADKLIGKLKAWQQDNDVLMPVPNPNYNP